jgi:hypothetical protein
MGWVVVLFVEGIGIVYEAVDVLMTAGAGRDCNEFMPM